MTLSFSVESCYKFIKKNYIPSEEDFLNDHWCSLILASCHKLDDVFPIVVSVLEIDSSAEIQARLIDGPISTAVEHFSDEELMEAVLKCPPCRGRDWLLEILKS